MLVQSEISEENDKDVLVIRLLPALPDAAAWKTGNIHGVGIKGGYTADFTWKDGCVTEFRLKSGEKTDKSLEIKTIPEVKIIYE